MRLYKRNVSGKTIWYARLWCEGKLVPRSMGTGNKEVAKRRAEEKQAEFDQATNRSCAKLPMTTAWQYYYAYASLRKKPKVLDHERMFWDQFWLHVGRKSADEVGTYDVESWRTALLTTPSKHGRVRSPHTVNDSLRAMSTIWNALIKLGHLSENPFSATEVPRVSIPPRRPKYLRKDEILKLLSLAEEHSRDAHLFFALGVYAGLRKGEILNLRWCDVDFERRDEEGRVVGCLYVWGSEGHEVKTSASNRVVPLHDQLKAVLSQYSPSTEAHERYVVRPRARVLNKDGYRWNVRRLFATMSEPLERKVTPHMLRHTFASQLAQRGVSLHKISKWLGHTSVTTTQIYAHLCPIDSEVSRL